MKCIINNCERTDIIARYMCEKHYHFFKRHKKLSNQPLMRREAGSGQINRDGYKRITTGNRRIFEHRHIVEISLGRLLLPNEKVHHIDGNKLNNNLKNLIVVSQSDHLTKFHNNRPKVFDWNIYVKHKSPFCIICNKPSFGNFDLCPNHYRTYRYWKINH